MKREITQKLENLDFEGKKIVRRVFDSEEVYSGPFLSNGPDLIALSEYGFDAKTLHIPGHSKGSIGILASSGDLFCGDIMVNIINKPLFNRFMADDNFLELDSSIERLKELSIKTVYPGHGKPFPMDKLKK